MTYRLTVGPAKDGRQIAVITQGGHPQFPGSGQCIVCTVAEVSELPNQDPDAWFERMKEERPWETRN